MSSELFPSARPLHQFPQAVPPADRSEGEPVTSHHKGLGEVPSLPCSPAPHSSTELLERQQKRRRCSSTCSTRNDTALTSATAEEPVPSSGPHRPPPPQPGRLGTSHSLGSHPRFTGPSPSLPGGQRKNTCAALTWDANPCGVPQTNPPPEAWFRLDTGTNCPRSKTPPDRPSRGPGPLRQRRAGHYAPHNAARQNHQRAT